MGSGSLSPDRNRVRFIITVELRPRGKKGSGSFRQRPLRVESSRLNQTHFPAPQPNLNSNHLSRLPPLLQKARRLLCAAAMDFGVSTHNADQYGLHRMRGSMSGRCVTGRAKHEGAR